MSGFVPFAVSVNLNDTIIAFLSTFQSVLLTLTTLDLVAVGSC